jgi:hypothetical protein
VKPAASTTVGVVRLDMRRPLAVPIALQAPRAAPKAVV